MYVSLLRRSDVLMLMRFALGEAERGLAERGLPIGCVAAVLSEHGLRVIGRAHEGSAHSVAAVLSLAIPKLRPSDSGLIITSTIEPCEACMEECRAAQVRELIYALPCRGTKSGTHPIAASTASAPGIAILSKVLAPESRKLLQSFVDRHEGPLSKISYAEELLRASGDQTHAA